MKTKILSFLAILTICLSAVFYFQSKGEKKGNEESEKEESSYLNLSEEKIKNLDLKTERVILSEYSTEIELIGETEAIPDAVIDIPARVAGRITSVHFIEGDKIQKGQLLAKIDSPELAKLRSVYQSAKAKYNASEQNIQRIRSLIQMNLAAKQELVDAEANLKLIRSERIAAEENLRANGLAVNDEVSGIYKLYSPKTGLAISRNAIPGSLIPSDQNLTTIADLSSLWFQAKIFEGDLQYLREGNSVKIVLNAYPDLGFEGKLDHIGEKVDPISRTIHARIVFKNKEKKGKIGLFGKAFVQTKPREGIRMNSGAILNYQNKNYVFVKVSEDKFRWTEVEIGQKTDGKIEIKQGLNENEEVVSQGSFELKSIFFKASFGEED